MARAEVHLNWSGPEHFDQGQSLPCRRCGTPTQMRDNDGQACHESCRAEELAQELFGADTARLLVDERFGAIDETAREVQR